MITAPPPLNSPNLSLLIYLPPPTSQLGVLLLICAHVCMSGCKYVHHICGSAYKSQILLLGPLKLELRVFVVLGPETGITGVRGAGI